MRYTSSYMLMMYSFSYDIKHAIPTNTEVMTDNQARHNSPGSGDMQHAGVCCVGVLVWFANNKNSGWVSVVRNISSYKTDDVQSLMSDLPLYSHYHLVVVTYS